MFSFYFFLQKFFSVNNRAMPYNTSNPPSSIMLNINPNSYVQHPIIAPKKTNNTSVKAFIGLSCRLFLFISIIQIFSKNSQISPPTKAQIYDNNIADNGSKTNLNISPNNQKPIKYEIIPAIRWLILKQSNGYISTSSEHVPINFLILNNLFPCSSDKFFCLC